MGTSSQGQAPRCRPRVVPRARLRERHRRPDHRAGGADPPDVLPLLHRQAGRAVRRLRAAPRGAGRGRAAGRRAAPDLAPFAALLTALTEVGDLVADEHAAERRAIVQASPELQERGLTKDAAVTSALAAALEQRGAQAPTAALLAAVGNA